MTLREIVDRLDSGRAANAGPRSWPTGTSSTSSSSVAGRLVRGSDLLGAQGIPTGVVAVSAGGQVPIRWRSGNFISVPYPRARSLPPPCNTRPRPRRRRHGPAVARRSDCCRRPHRRQSRQRRRAPVLLGGDLHRCPLADRWTSRRTGYRNRGVAYCPHCDGPLFRASGRGSPAAATWVEAAIDLAASSPRHPDRVRRPAPGRRRAPAQQAAACPTSTSWSRRSPPRCTATEHGHRSSGTALRVGPSDRADGVFVQIGLLPITEWLEGAVEAVALTRGRDRRPRPGHRYPGCSPPGIAPRSRSSRS